MVVKQTLLRDPMFLQVVLRPGGANVCKPRGQENCSAAFQELLEEEKVPMLPSTVWLLFKNVCALSDSTGQCGHHVTPLICLVQSLPRHQLTSGHDHTT